MTDLPKYDGHWATCVKCGLLSEVRCQYVPATAETQFVMRALIPAEHLELTCGNCGYRWPVACADSHHD